MKKITIFLFLTVILLFLVSCNLDDPFRQTVSGDFIYSKVGVSNPDKNVAIIGLSEEGKTKETIVFPTTIDGYNVSKIGTSLVKRSSGPIVFTNAKNIYFPTINFKTHSEFDYSENKELSVYIGSRYADIEIFDLINSVKFNKVFVKKEFYDDEERIGQLDKYNYIPANVSYYLSDNPNDSFFIDDVDGSTVNVIPPDPYKEGYDFVGWYKDLEGINAWDFNNDVVPEKLYDEEGNYIFVETKIYAIWRLKSSV